MYHLSGHSSRVSRPSGVRYSPYPSDTSGKGAVSARHPRRRHSFDDRDTLFRNAHGFLPNGDMNGTTGESNPAVLHANGGANGVTHDPIEIGSDHQLVRALHVVERLSRQVENMEKLLERLTNGVDRMEASQPKAGVSQANGEPDSHPEKPTVVQLEVSADVERQPEKLPLAEQKVIKSLIRHHLIQPLETYSTVRQLVSTYIDHNAARLKLDSFVKDSTVLSAVDSFLAAQVRYLKTQLRIQVLQSIQNSTNLHAFAAKTVASHHLPTVPDLVPDNILATLALMRGVATTQGGQISFWKGLEVELSRLRAKHGSDRKSTAWLSWEKETIEADCTKYGTGVSPSSAAPTVRGAELLGPGVVGPG